MTSAPVELFVHAPFLTCFLVPRLQLGLGHRFNQHKPQLVRALESEFVIAAACGQQHTLVLTQSGDIWSWGLGVFGQLGHGSLHDEKLPRKIATFQRPDQPDRPVRISAIACGSHHSLALDSDGFVWSWGSSEYAQQFQADAKVLLALFLVSFGVDLSFCLVNSTMRIGAPLSVVVRTRTASRTTTQYPV